MSVFDVCEVQMDVLVRVFLSVVFAQDRSPPTLSLLSSLPVYVCKKTLVHTLLTMYFCLFEIDYFLVH